MNARRLTFAIVCLLLFPVSNLVKADCASFYSGLNSTHLQHDSRFFGNFEIQLVEGHDDIYRGRTLTGQEFIFRTNPERAKLEVSVYRFAHAAGFDVPLTTYANINGMEGSAQLSVGNLTTAADAIAKNGYVELPKHRANAETRVFDALLGINDRNPTNYFLRDNGRQTLIDHEQAFYSRPYETGLIDSDGKAIDAEVVRRFQSLNSEAAFSLAQIGRESDWLWALRDLTEHQRNVFRERLKIYRRLYREVGPRESRR